MRFFIVIEILEMNKKYAILKIIYVRLKLKKEDVYA